MAMFVGNGVASNTKHPTGVVLTDRIPGYVRFAEICSWKAGTSIPIVTWTITSHLLVYLPSHATCNCHLDYYTF
jgi:hypothetical protein